MVFYKRQTKQTGRNESFILQIQTDDSEISGLLFVCLMMFLNCIGHVSLNDRMITNDELENM